MTNKCPLYDGFSLPDRGQWQNWGLVYDKFCNVWSKKSDKWSLGDNKKKWLEGFARIVGNRDLIEDMSSRLQRLVEARGGNIIFVRTAGRFVTGMGNENPAENGFAWHPTLGTPYMPGSSVKGMLRAWMQEWVTSDPRQINAIFGSANKNSDSSAGNVMFYDALPLSPIKLTLDVMTPHYADYYRGDAPPGDWQSPVPIPFLTVDSDQQFMFAIAPRTRDGDQYMDLLEQEIYQAIEIVGAGAKTAVGYGRFIIDAAQKSQYVDERTKREEVLLKQREIAELSPVQREMEADGYGDDQVFINKVDAWLDRAEKAEVSERQEIAEALRDWYQRYRKGMFDNPNKKNRPRVERLKKLLR